MILINDLCCGAGLIIEPAAVCVNQSDHTVYLVPAPGLVKFNIRVRISVDHDIAEHPADHRIVAQVYLRLQDHGLQPLGRHRHVPDVLPVFHEIYASLGGRLTGVAGGLLLIYPGIVTDSIGFALVGIVFVIQLLTRKKSVSPLADS